MNEINAIANFISNVGFPIAMVWMLMTRFEKKTEDQTKKIEGLSDLIKSKDGILDKVEEIADKIDKCCKERR